MLAVLGLTGALTSVFFCLQQPWGVFPVVLLVTLAAGVAAGVAGVLRPAQGQLRWDGERWPWSDAEEHAVTHLACVVDLQRFMLLREGCGRGSNQWRWLHSPAMDACWLAFRRAVVVWPQAMTHAGQSSLPG